MSDDRRHENEEDDDLETEEHGRTSDPAGSLVDVKDEPEDDDVPPATTAPRKTPKQKKEKKVTPKKQPATKKATKKTKKPRHSDSEEGSDESDDEPDGDAGPRTKYPVVNDCQRKDWPESEVVTEARSERIASRNRMSPWSYSRDWAKMHLAIIHNIWSLGGPGKAPKGWPAKKNFHNKLRLETELAESVFTPEHGLRSGSIFRAQADKWIKDGIFADVTGIPEIYWRYLDPERRKLDEDAGETKLQIELYLNSDKRLLTPAKKRKILALRQDSEVKALTIEDTDPPRRGINGTVDPLYPPYPEMRLPAMADLRATPRSSLSQHVATSSGSSPPSAESGPPVEPGNAALIQGRKDAGATPHRNSQKTESKPSQPKSASADDVPDLTKPYPGSSWVLKVTSPKPVHTSSKAGGVPETASRQTHLQTFEQFKKEDVQDMIKITSSLVAISRRAVIQQRIADEQEMAKAKKPATPTPVRVGSDTNLAREIAGKAEAVFNNFSSRMTPFVNDTMRMMMPTLVNAVDELEEGIKVAREDMRSCILNAQAKQIQEEKSAKAREAAANLQTNQTTEAEAARQKSMGGAMQRVLKTMNLNPKPLSRPAATPEKAGTALPVKRDRLEPTDQQETQRLTDSEQPAEKKRKIDHDRQHTEKIGEPLAPQDASGKDTAMVPKLFAHRDGYAVFAMEPRTPTPTPTQPQNDVAEPDTEVGTAQSKPGAEEQDAGTTSGDTDTRMEDTQPQNNVTEPDTEVGTTQPKPRAEEQDAGTTSGDTDTRMEDTQHANDEKPDTLDVNEQAVQNEQKPATPDVQNEQKPATPDVQNEQKPATPDVQNEQKPATPDIENEQKSAAPDVGLAE